MTTQLYIEQLKLKDITNIRPCMLLNLYDDYDKIKANGYNLSSLDCQCYVRTLDEHDNFVIFVTYLYYEAKPSIFITESII